jgi:hypothetical protein
MRNLVLWWLVGGVALVGIGIVVLLTLRGEELALPPAPVAEAPAPYVPEPVPVRSVVGTSVEGRAIEAYTYGTGTTHLLFVGGVHGGYEWNSVLLAYTYLDHLHGASTTLPDNVRITVIPALNPDGLFRVIGKEGRFTLADVPETVPVVGLGRVNARGVDLNRNFDCKWQPEAVWRGNKVGAGTAPFSEPEALALKQYVAAHAPDAVIFWHSKSNAVYASECENGILPATRTLMNTYAQAAGYPTVDVFDAYPVTGDAEGWLASIGIPAVTVELSTHETIEWEKNLAGIQATVALYATP